MAYSQIPGWESATGVTTLEVHNSVGGVVAQDGGKYVELDGRSGNNQVDGFFQDVQTELGKEYTLSFWMRARIRNNADTISETLKVTWNGVELKDGGYQAEPGAWRFFETTVIGTGQLDRLSFLEYAAGNDGLGIYLDNISLEGPPEIKKDLRSTGKSSGGSGGDPHFKTWTGVKYDYHGECDLVLLNNPTFDNGRGLRVHIRTVRKGYYSYIERVAMQIGEDVLEFAGIDDFYINGEKTNKNEAKRFAGYELRTHSRAISIRLDNANKEKIDFIHRKNGFLYTAIDGKNPVFFEGSLGMIGDWTTGQMIGRDGASQIDDPEQFALEWQVRDTEPMLFQSVRAPQFPATCVPPKKMLGTRLGSAAMQRKAEEVCAEHGDDIAECVFDVMATRDLGAAAF